MKFYAVLWQTVLRAKGKDKGQVLDIALLHDEHIAQERFTISEVAAD